MEIFYCDSCGKRATADDKQQSLALSPDRIFCKECFAKQAPTKSEPVVKAISSSTAKMIAGTAATPTRRPKSDTPNRVGTGRGKEENAPAQKNNLPVFLIGGMLVTFALVLVILSSQGSKKPPAAASNASSSSATAPDPVPAKPAPLPAKPAPSSSSGAVERPVPVVAPAETKTRELTPKEIFEQKAREEKLNPAKPPDLPAAQGAKANLLAIATPSADDPSWKKLFNGADMTGWEMPKGSWDVVDGKMRCTPNAERGGSIVSNLEYGDFELIIRFKCNFQAEWYVRSDTSFYLDLRDNTDWRTFRAVAKGRDVHASLDGKVLTPMVSGLAQSSISAFVHQACKDYQVEEARLRSLKPEEGAPAPAPDPAAAVGEEKEIFNGKDLTGWKMFKGAWTVEDGAITNGTEASARLESLAQFANYELTFQVKIEAGRHAEVQVLNYTWYAEITRALAPDYKDCKVVVRGADVTVTLDGKALPLLSESNDKAVTSGPIGFYVPKDMKCRIKNVRVKPLK